MTDPSHLPRVYGEKEIGRILKRATEIQHDEPSAPSASGLTLAELEDIAREAGIDPRHLRRAAAEIDTGEPGASFGAKLAGDQLSLLYGSVVPGEIPQEGFERVVVAIQQVAREHGHPSLLGRTLTWQAESSNKSRTIQIIVSARGGETEVRIEERLHQLAAGIFGGGITGVGAGLGLGVGIPLGMNIFGSALLATLFPVSTVALTFIAAREAYRAIVRHRRRVVSELFDRVIAEVTRSIDERTIDAGTDADHALPELPRG